MQLDKAKIRHSFSAASVTYDGVAELQRTVGYALLNNLHSPIAGTLVDIGCGTGFLTAELSRFNPELLIALDMALPMLHATRDKLAHHTLLCADAEYLPLMTGSINHVFSNLALQWCSNLLAVFTDIKRLLKPDGRLIFSTFAPQTLQELKTAWAKVDDYAHVNDFYSDTQITDFLQQAGFTNISITRTLYTPQYDSVLALMRELKHIGAHNVQSGRNKHCTTKTAMQTMMTAYQSAYQVNGKIPASFEVFIVEAN